MNAAVEVLGPTLPNVHALAPLWMQVAAAGKARDVDGAPIKRGAFVHSHKGDA